MSLVGAFFCLAGIYALLLAHTIAILQVLVYAGAIMVLFLFVIMLLSLGEAVAPSKITFSRVVGFLTAFGLFWALVYAASPFVPAAAPTPASFGTLQSIGAHLYTQCLAPLPAPSPLLPPP